MTRLKTCLGICLITVLLLEIFGLFIYRNQSNWKHRYLFSSRDARVQIDDEFWTYRPNSRIRIAAVYGFPIGTPWVEFNCVLETNEFGITKTHATGLDSYDLLVLGDSFTEGQGGCPWLTTETVKDLGFSLLNGGLNGAGVTTFARMERHVTERSQIGNVLILAISDDFYREPDASWVKKAEPCLVDGICDEKNYWWSLDSEFGRETLLSVGRMRAVQRFQAYSIPLKLKRLCEQLSWHSLSARLLTTYIRLAAGLAASEASRAETSAIFETNMSALRSLRKKYPELRLVLVSQRDEVGLLGGKNRATRQLETRLGKENIPYERCELAPNDFMRIDAHPNKQGYAKLWRCAFEQDRTSAAG